MTSYDNCLVGGNKLVKFRLKHVLILKIQSILVELLWWSKPFRFDDGCLKELIL